MDDEVSDEELEYHVILYGCVWEMRLYVCENECDEIQHVNVQNGLSLNVSDDEQLIHGHN